MTAADDERVAALRAVAGRWALDGRLLDAAPYGNGHINDTLLAVWEIDGVRRRWIHQRLNTTVFPDPAALMDNVQRVCTHQSRLLAGADDAHRRHLQLVPGRDGNVAVIDASGHWWRCYPFIEDSVCRETVRSPAEAEAAARAFGAFLRGLASLPGRPLHETIVRFHDTPHRLEALRVAAERDVHGRACECRAEVAFALERAEGAGVVIDGLTGGRLPPRSTHNDTKINNVLLDATSGEGLCVIDLDTLMPGSPLYDISDLLRTSVSTGAEDEPRPETIDLRLAVLEAVYRGFLAELGDTLTTAERSLLPTTASLMTYECAVRFLTDHLAGDVYFRIHHPGHNLQRARSQFALVAAFERHAGTITDICNRLGA